jgi:hypothetical protein
MTFKKNYSSRDTIRLKLCLSTLIRIVAGSDTSTSRGADQLVAQHSAIKMLASRTVFLYRDMLTTIWIRIRNKLTCFETYLLFKCCLLSIITTFSIQIAIFSVILETVHSPSRCSPAGQSLPGIYSPQSESGFCQILAWSDTE